MKHLFSYLFLLTFILTLAIGPSVSQCAAAAHSQESLKSPGGGKVHASYGNIPLQFEANHGQINNQVKFLSRGSGYSLFLTPREVVLALRKPTNPSLANSLAIDGKESAEQARAGRVKPDAVRMTLADSNPNPHVAGQEALPGKVNYFIGNNPKKWRTNIATYKKVRYTSVYPGVDLVYYGNQKQLEYDFVVAPGANPKAIRLKFSGVRRMQVNAHGELVLGLPGGDIRWKTPVIYQDINGVRQAIKGGYVMNGGRQVGFHVAAYDRKKPLVIDPILVYSTYLGGSDYDEGHGIAVDTSGNAYVTGYAYSTDFPTQSALHPTIGSTNGFEDAFVTKLNAAGTALIYSTYIGGSNVDRGHHIAVDSGGNAYVTGWTQSTDFPTQNPFQATYHGGQDAFVLKLNPTGSALVYSTYLGGSAQDNGYGIAVDNAGNAYLTGITSSTDFPVQNALQTTKAGGSDAYVAKLNASGSALIYSTYLGGSNNDFPYGIAVDGGGDAYVAGETKSADFPTQNPLQSTNLAGAGHRNAFVVSLNPSGTALVYSTYLGGSTGDGAFGIAVDGSGNAYVTGYALSSDFPLHNPIQSVNYGGSIYGDAFVTKLNPSGSTLIYSTFLGGTGGYGDGGGGIAVDDAGNAFVAGWTSAADFPLASPIQAAYHGGVYDAFVAQLNTTGSALVYSSYLGGSAEDVATGIAVDGAGNAYLAGYTNSGNFPTQNAIQATNHGLEDAFVAKISNPIPPAAPAALSANPGNAEVTLGWPDSSNATSYNVKRSTVNGGPYSTIASVDFNLYSDTGLTNGVTYYYVVSAVNGNGESANSTQASATPMPPIPAAPTGLTASAGSGQVSLAWTASTGATSYNVKRSTANGGSYATVANSLSASYANTGLTNGVTYYYVVSALNISGESVNSAQAGATPEPQIPAIPTGLAASAGIGQISLTWTASTGATSYNVKRATISGGPYSIVSSPTTNSYANLGLINGTTYYFVVSAVNGVGESGNSNQVSATPGIYPFDFNGDGKPDLVLQNSTSNQVSIWFMNGATVTGGQYVSLTPAAGWRVAGVGDFNGDGRPDLVLQNASMNKAAIWNLNGTMVLSGQYVSANIPPGWSIVAVGDFNGDGKPDIVLQSASTNQVAIWYMNGATLTSGGYTSATPAAGWRVVGAGDFNADGKTDLVLQNSTTNQVALWYLNGATLVGGAYVSAIPPSGYSVVGIGDFNGDHKPDLVLQDAGTNKVAFWYMNGATVAGGAYTSATPPVGWTVVGPR